MRNNFLLAATAAGTAVGHADTLAGGPHLSERSVGSTAVEHFGARGECRGHAGGTTHGDAIRRIVSEARGYGWRGSGGLAMLAEKIVGVWQLQSWATVVDDKIVGYPLGEQASGFFVYHPAGFMSVNMDREIFYSLPEARS